MTHNRPGVLRALRNCDAIEAVRPDLSPVVETIRAALQSCLDDGWNFNMDEAPKDGTVFLVGTPPGMYGGMTMVMFLDGSFRSPFNGNIAQFPMKCWRPLPTPPEKGQPND